MTRTYQLAGIARTLAYCMEADGCCHALTLRATLYGIRDVLGDILPCTWDEAILALHFAAEVLEDESPSQGTR